MKRTKTMIIVLTLLMLGIVAAGCGKMQSKKSRHRTSGVSVIYLPRIGGTGITPHYIIH